VVVVLATGADARGSFHVATATVTGRSLVPVQGTAIVTVLGLVTIGIILNVITATVASQSLGRVVVTLIETVGSTIRI